MTAPPPVNKFSSEDTETLAGYVLTIADNLYAENQATRAAKLYAAAERLESLSASPAPGTRALIDRQQRIAAIAARVQRASAGPWMTDERFPNCVYCDDELGSRVADCNASHAMLLREEGMAANADFIANAPTDIAWLLEELAVAAPPAGQGAAT